ncbi:uncharacterized protein LOC114726316 isoform X2 [Neltuma alba]|uniref:uncharacterized protein LOC114726316 isoform X2 n=1 Tax=Neltuma alba TaxID=207710 RepID=UPI0010A51103|nr:uncharacterized protein LOC114726316 isoform X2 [Prosopis alba]
MEAVGSRLGRASSRYGTPTVFTGPVRKWKKKWVHVSPPSSSSVSSHNSHHSNSANGSDSRLLLCRWTPITASSASPADNSSANASDEPPRRKFRYTPIAVLEEQKRVAVGKAENGPTTETGQSTARPTTMTQETRGKLNMNETSEEETQILDIRNDVPCVFVRNELLCNKENAMPCF